MNSRAEAVYRTPGRVTDVAPVRLPPWRALAAPLGRAVALVALLVAPILLFNAVSAPLLDSPREVRFVPMVDHVEDALALAIVGSLLVLVALIAQRVAPSWRGVRLRSKVVYVGALLVAQTTVVLAAETAVFFSRGGLHLFEGTLKSSAVAPDGRTAHVYGGGASCAYEVFVAEPNALLMKRSLFVARKSCDEAIPRVRWNADRTVDLVDAAGTKLESESRGSLFGIGGC
jgi:hypothetical protein